MTMKVERCKFVYNLSCDEVSDRIAALEDENEKLREQIQNLRDDWESERDYADQMQEKERRAVAENERLRELIRDVNRAAHMLCEAWEGSCSKEAEGMSLHAVCPISDTNELCVFGELYHRTREMGIEVDG